MSLTGNISTMSLAEIFQWLNSGLKTGTLHVHGSDGIEKEVYFENGVIVSASSSDPRELIGQFLVNCNKISESQLTGALDQQKRDHLLLGRVLVQQKVITQQELLEILCNISEEVIYDLFLWKEGQFEFKDGVLPEREMHSLNMDITHIVLEGARREDEWLRIKRVFTNENIPLRPQIEKMAEVFPLAPEKARLMCLVNGQRTIYEISRLYRATKFEACHALLDLYEMGLIELGDFRQQTIQPVSKVKGDPVKEMLTYIESLLKQGRIEEADYAAGKLKQEVPEHPEVIKVLAEIEDKKLATTAKKVIRTNSVPVLAMDMNKITQLTLSPEEGFIASRINGVWDVKSIIKISPFDESLCLKIFKQFMDKGVIKFK